MIDMGEAHIFVLAARQEDAGNPIRATGRARKAVAKRGDAF